MKLHTIFIGVIFSIVIFSGLYLYLIDGAEQYGSDNLPADFNRSYVLVKNQLDAINSTTSSIRTQLENTDTQSNILDFLGFFFNAGYQALKSSLSLVGTFFLFIDESLNVLGGGVMGPILKTALYGSVIVIFFVAIIMQALVKGDNI